MGAEVLVRGAARLSSALGVSPLIVGLTVVAYGTSSAELACARSAVLGQNGLAIGIVVGTVGLIQNGLNCLKQTDNLPRGRLRCSEASPDPVQSSYASVG